MARPEIKRIAVLVRLLPGWSRALLRGIGRFCQHQRDWLAYPIDSSDPAHLTLLGDAPIHGVLGTQHGTSSASYLHLPCPVVMMAGSRPEPGLAHVQHDDLAIGRLAAEHLLGKGFRHFGYVGLTSNARAQGFVQTLAAAGHRCELLQFNPVTGPSAYGHTVPLVQQWLTARKTPLAVMAFADPIAAAIIEAARLLNMSVPDELAVIGVDNDEIVCDLCNPALSSVNPDFESIGYHAAALLERLLTGHSPADLIHRIPPRSVVERASTDAYAYPDPDIRTAVRFIRQNALEPIHVADVVKSVLVSRRTLESRFQSAVGRTIHDEIWRHRLERAMMLLRQTDWDLARIAADCAFASLAHLSRSVKQASGLSPRRYRIAHRTPR